MSHQESRSWITGVKAKLYSGGGEEVDHSRVRPCHGSPVGSRSCSRLRILTAIWIRKHRMPSAIRKAPKQATTNRSEERRVGQECVSSVDRDGGRIIKKTKQIQKKKS